MATKGTQGTSRRRNARQGPALTRERIVRAAIALVNTRGLDALSIRSVATDLDAWPMALYNHVTDRQDLEVAMLEQATSTLKIDDDAQSPMERVHNRFIALHDTFATQIWALHILIRGDLVPVNSFVFADANIGDLIAAGVNPDTVIVDYGTLWHLTLGELLDRHPAALPTAPSQRHTALTNMPVEKLPNYAHVLRNLDPLDAAPPCHYARSLRLLLDALSSAT